MSAAATESVTKFKVVVPARYASTRLPAKPLLDLGGKPMVARVAERGVLSGADEVWVATDHAAVMAARCAAADSSSGSGRVWRAPPTASHAVRAASGRAMAMLMRARASSGMAGRAPGGGSGGVESVGAGGVHVSSSQR